MTTSPSEILAVSPSLPPWKAWVKTHLLFGHEPTQELIAILLVYFVQGILGLSRLAVTFFLKDDLGLTPAETAALTGLGIIPWTLKPLLGVMSDGFPMGGYRRRSYLALFGQSEGVAFTSGKMVCNPGDRFDFFDDCGGGCDCRFHCGGTIAA